MAYGLIINLLLLLLLNVAEGKEVAPYLLPENHAVKPMLDAIFSQSRVTLHLNSLLKAGFEKTKPRKFTKLIVTKHPQVPGFIFKLYLDAQRFHKDIPESEFWIARAEGANQTRQFIKKNNLESHFKVPHKWIYELPRHPEKTADYVEKFYILVEEDMFILPNNENKTLWASSHVTFELLEELYLILSKIGLYDAARPDNIPFSYDGKIAFIDTQTFGKKSVRYEKLNPYLSLENHYFWEAITSKK